MKNYASVSAVAICVFAVSCSNQKPENGNEFVVGLLAPKSGVMAVHGDSMEMGVRVAEKVLNDKGGVLGKKLRTVVLDTQSDPAVAAQRAREMIDRDHVALLLGTGLSSETLAVIPVSTASRVPFVYSMDGELKTCSSDNPRQVSHFVWGAGFTERMIVEPFLTYLANNVLPKRTQSRIYFLGGDYVYPRNTNEFARAKAESMGFKVVGDEYVDVSTSDYTPVIRRIMSSGADMLLVTNPGSAAATFMRQAQQLGLGKRMLISGFATFAQEAIGEMGTAAEGVVYANRYTDLVPGSTNAEFVKTFRSMYSKNSLLPGPTAAAGGYGAMLVAAAAFQKAGSFNTGAFYQAMRGLTLDLPQGEITVDPDNNIFRQPMYLLRIRNQKYDVIGNLGLQTHPDLAGCSVK